MPHFLITQGTASCTANDVSYEPEGSMPGMAADIAAGTFYNYVFISPNMCDDGHDSCSPLNNQITQQDDWLSTNVPLILNSSAFKNNGFLFITWDEGASDSDAIMAVAVSPMVANPGGQDNNNYTHYSLLSTVEAGFGLSSLPQLHGHNDPLITTILEVASHAVACRRSSPRSTPRHESPSGSSRRNAFCNSARCPAARGGSAGASPRPAESGRATGGAPRRR